MDSSVEICVLYRKAMNLQIPCMTSIDTALALAMLSLPATVRALQSL
ncbi:MAG: hypothetical protein ACLR56_09150 [Oscillospiraceae bacterium]